MSLWSIRKSLFSERQRVARIEASRDAILNAFLLTTGWDEHVMVARDSDGVGAFSYRTAPSEALFRMDGRHERLLHFQSVAAQQVMNVARAME